MNVLIVEDEKLAADQLERLLLSMEGTYKVAATLDSVKKTVEWLQNHTPDLLLMDIHLADDISFKILEAVEVRAPIIFTTAYDQYAIQAFKHISIDYLLKPISREDLEKALQKLKNRVQQTSAVHYQQLAELLRQGGGPEYKKRFLVSTGSKIKTIPVEEASCFFAEGRYVTLFTKNGQKYIIDQTMDHLQDSLDPEMFFRVNRQFLVSIESIVQMYVWSKSRLKLVLSPDIQHEVIVSIDRSPEFKKWLNK